MRLNKTAKKPIKRGKRGRFAQGTAPGPGRPRKGERAADYVEQGISAEELIGLLARSARHGSISAMKILAEYRFGRSMQETHHEDPLDLSRFGIGSVIAWSAQEGGEVVAAPEMPG